MITLITSAALRAGEVETHSGEGDRVGTDRLLAACLLAAPRFPAACRWPAACRPDHTHLPRIRATTSPISWERFL